MENKLETSLDILASGIEEKSEGYLLLATDPEAGGATLLSCSVEGTALIVLLTEFLKADERFISATETALKIIYAHKKGA